MAAECNVSIIADVTGLGEDLSFSDKFVVTATLIKAAKNRQIQAVADTDEALNLCGISTVELIIIKASSNDLLIDTDYVSSFDADQSVGEGETRVIKPSGVVHIKNEDAGEACTIDYLIVGSA
jgi:hypothetical protein